ncbi:hypothetical protein Agub_g2536 [Astrephomene gubernaculifera]|uniref:RNA ligase/cyclic nucleotide phosphodiesterase family protein n=1 Tax=Astrephomene gubernaculifera TaxID=47775 RepID=A0AAD3DKX8_9CHLO|nr:hypothetical protein Agub_g2536 [Astrephomene gubernaculifera]
MHLLRIHLLPFPSLIPHRITTLALHPTAPFPCRTPRVLHATEPRHDDFCRFPPPSLGPPSAQCPSHPPTHPPPSSPARLVAAAGCGAVGALRVLHCGVGGAVSGGIKTRLHRYNAQQQQQHQEASIRTHSSSSASQQLAGAPSVCAAAMSSSAADPTTSSAGLTTSSAGLSDLYSLWAMPRGALGEQLRAEIAGLAARQAAGAGGDGAAPPAFPPHVTVLGDIPGPREEVMRRARELAGKIKKYRINFTGVAAGASYYQCVYLLVAREEGPLAAAAAARQQYGMTTPPYMPHLSLLYSDAEPAERAKVVDSETGRLYGEGSGYDSLLVETGFEVDRLAVWYTPTEDRSTGAWSCVGEVELAGGE